MSMHAITLNQQEDGKVIYATTPNAPNGRYILEVAAADQQAARFTKITDAAGVHIITRDEQTGLEWSARDIGSFTNNVKNSKAEAACAALTLGGHSDWRLPTVEELESIRDRGRALPAIDTDAFPSCNVGWYWSSTPHAYDPETYAWVVSFGYGYSYLVSRGSYGRVRAVRSSRQSSASLVAEGDAVGA